MFVFTANMKNDSYTDVRPMRKVLFAKHNLSNLNISYIFSSIKSMY
jgi:hypothetical protein